MEVEQIINQIDEDGNGGMFSLVVFSTHSYLGLPEIDPDEFIEGFRRSGRCTYSAEDVLRALSVISQSDTHVELRGTGAISVDGLVEFIMKHSPEKPSREELYALISALPIDRKTNTFAYEHFVATMIN